MTALDGDRVAPSVQRIQDHRMTVTATVGIEFLIGAGRHAPVRASWVVDGAISLLVLVDRATLMLVDDRQHPREMIPVASCASSRMRTAVASRRRVDARVRPMTTVIKSATVMTNTTITFAVPRQQERIVREAQAHRMKTRGLRVMVDRARLVLVGEPHPPQLLTSYITQFITERTRVAD